MKAEISQYRAAFVFLAVLTGSAASASDSEIVSLEAYVTGLGAEYPDGGELYCETESGGERVAYVACEDFAELQEKGCYGYSTYDMSLEAGYGRMCRRTAALSSAKAPEANYFHIESDDWWKVLPAEVIPMSGGAYSEESWAIAAERRRALVKGKLLADIELTEVESRKGEFAATLESSTLECGVVRNRLEFKATLFADFDGDGSAEMLLEGFRVDRSDGCQLGTANSLGASFSAVVKKERSDASISVLEVPGID